MPCPETAAVALARAEETKKGFVVRAVTELLPDKDLTAIGRHLADSDVQRRTRCMTRCWKPPRATPCSNRCADAAAPGPIAVSAPGA